MADRQSDGALPEARCRTVELTVKLEAGQKGKLDYVVKRFNVEP